MKILQKVLGGGLLFWTHTVYGQTIIFDTFAGENLKFKPVLITFSVFCEFKVLILG